MTCGIEPWYRYCLEGDMTSFLARIGWLITGNLEGGKEDAARTSEKPAVDLPPGSLPALAREISLLSRQKTRAIYRTTRVLNFLVAAGSFFIASATFELTPPGQWTNWNYFGLIASIVVLISALVLLGTQTDSYRELEHGRAALNKAQDLQTRGHRKDTQFAEIEEVYKAEIERLSHLQAGRDLIRAIIEDVASSQLHRTDEDVISRILSQAQRSLFLAHGFRLNEHYTICIYKAKQDPDSKKFKLHCVAHIRSIMCDLTESRTWAEGVGVAGVAYARKSEIVVPDLLAPQLGTLYNLPEKKQDDDSKYRSIVAEPIFLESSDPWGILVSTSSEPDHFSIKNRAFSEVAQSLAGMISLAIKVNRCKSGPRPTIAAISDTIPREAPVTGV
jgi:hypothetical protein